MAREYQTSSLSRERNRIHARKTRQRKKEQMQTLQSKADELKEEQVNLKQQINEKNTASILVGLVSVGKRQLPRRQEDPAIEALMRRPMDEIPDSSKLPELPALILPGQHNDKKPKASGPSPKPSKAAKEDLPDDGIDYELLGKDRSKCTPAELDQIRRERNRMHAKRTRDRKRLYMEEMGEMCKQLETENALLRRHLDSLGGSCASSVTYQEPHCASQAELCSHSALIAPSMPSSPAASMTAPKRRHSTASLKPPPPPDTQQKPDFAPDVTMSQHGVTLDQIRTLLEAAEAFPSASEASAVSHSACDSEDGNSSDNTCEVMPKKRARLSPSSPRPIVATSLPLSITTSSDPSDTFDRL